MGSVVPFPADDDVEGGMLNQQFTMQSLSLGDFAGGEGGASDTDVGHGVGVATADQVTDGGASAMFPLGQALVNEAGREAQSAASHAAALFGGGPRPLATRPQTGGALRPGAGGAAVAGAGATAGLFGDLFGEHTDTIVIATGLLVAGGLAWMLIKHHAERGKHPRRRAR